jgi:hypothetical protein
MKQMFSCVESTGALVCQIRLHGTGFTCALAVIRELSARDVGGQTVNSIECAANVHRRIAIVIVTDRQLSCGKPLNM